eukprot:12410015-Alexandrium_andersonii.AAC.1
MARKAWATIMMATTSPQKIITLYYSLISFWYKGSNGGLKRLSRHRGAASAFAVPVRCRPKGFA